MAGQNNHFANYAVEKLPYAIDRYRNEVNRLYGVLNRRLADRAFVAGDYSIADMASYPGSSCTSARARTSTTSARQTLDRGDQGAARGGARLRQRRRGQSECGRIRTPRDARDPVGQTRPQSTRQPRKRGSAARCTSAYVSRLSLRPPGHAR